MIAASSNCHNSPLKYCLITDFLQISDIVPRKKNTVSAKDVGRMKERKLVGGYPPEKRVFRQTKISAPPGESVLSICLASKRPATEMESSWAIPSSPTFRGLLPARVVVLAAKRS
ncbi:hypothetical protein CDAR_196531 [Caerostris darwini]|uniref:Uncharacterized protein n=1 Tax=Caerostris darwini TaxID=1538125 RepID=A0AAV4PZT0_9ARAC|nr:hypothetical protein CDAR_196531 [Caerostris darwini]